MCSERWRETYAKYLLHGVSRVEVEPALHAHNAHSFEVAKHQAVAMALDVGCWESGNAGIRNNNAVLDEVERRLDQSAAIDPAPEPHAALAELRDRLAAARSRALEATASAARTERLADADIEPADSYVISGRVVQDVTDRTDVGNLIPCQDQPYRVLTVEDADGTSTNQLDLNLASETQD